MRKSQKQIQRVSLKSSIYKRQPQTSSNALNKSVGYIQKSELFSVGNINNSKQNSFDQHQTSNDKIGNRLTPRITNRMLNSNQQPIFQKVCCPNCRYLFRVLMAQTQTVNKKTEIQEAQKKISSFERVVVKDHKKIGQDKTIQRLQQFTQTYEKQLLKGAYRLLPSSPNIQTVKIKTAKTSPIKNISIFDIDNKNKYRIQKQLGENMTKNESSITFSPQAFQKSQQKSQNRYQNKIKGQIKSQSKSNNEQERAGNSNDAQKSNILKQLLVKQVFVNQRLLQMNQIVDSIQNQQLPSYVKLLVIDYNQNSRNYHNS